MSAMGGAERSEKLGESGGGATEGGKSEGCGDELGVVGTECSGERNEILFVTQSINGLWRVSQLCPRTREQEPSNGVT